LLALPLCVSFSSASEMLRDYMGWRSCISEDELEQ
jgi:hypothetical protein